MLAARFRAFTLVACVVAGALAFAANAADTRPAIKVAAAAKKKPASDARKTPAKAPGKPAAKPGGESTLSVTAWEA